MAKNKHGNITPLTAPLMIQLHPTNRCNLNCRFCWRHNFPPDSPELSDERWLEIADEICSLGVPQVTLNGSGEPLMRAELILQMMERFSRAGIDGSLITNGTLITEDVARRIVELQWRSVQVSIHAPIAQLNDFLMRKKGAFNLALQGIEHINTYKRLRKRPFPELTMRMVATRFNLSFLPEFIRFAKSQNAEWVAVRMVTDGAGSEGKCSLSERERRQFEEIARDAKELAEKVGVLLDFEFEIDLSPPAKAGNHNSLKMVDTRKPEREAQGKNKREPLCPSPFCELAIFSNGTAGPCALFHFSDVQFKNKKERVGWLEDITHQPLIQVWQQGFANLRMSMVSKDNICASCMRCSMDKNHPAIACFNRFDTIFNNFMEHKKYRQGIQLYLELLKKYPNNPKLYNYLAELHMGLKQYDASLKALERFESLGGDLEGTHFRLGKCYLEMGEYKKALRRFKKHLTQGASRGDQFCTWYSMAVCHEELGQFETMKHCLDKAKDILKPTYREGDVEETQSEQFFQEAFRYLRELRQYNEGIQFGLEQLKTNPNSAILHHYVGEFHMELEEYGKAIEHLSKAVQLDTTREWTRFSLGKSLYLTGRYKEAEKALKDNLKLTSEKLSHYHSWLFLAMTADSRRRKKDCSRALDELKNFREHVGQEISIEQEFLTRLEHEKRLPAWLNKAREGNNKDGGRELDLQREEIINREGIVGVVEKPRELCEIARHYSETGRLDKAEETVKKALEMAEAVKGECPWKFTNNLCYAAGLFVLCGNHDEARGILGRAIKSLADIDAHYLKRKKEIFSYLKMFSENKHVLNNLDFNPRNKKLTEAHAQEPPDDVQLHTFFTDKRVKELESAVENNLSNKEISNVVSGIDEEWKQAIALVIISRFFLGKSNVKRASGTLNLALKKGKTVPCYWDRDRVLENISEIMLEAYSICRKERLLEKAKGITTLMKDHWKRARALCRIARTLIEEKRFEQAAQELNHIHSHLLDRIDYRDRTAMSMLLIAEVFDNLDEVKRAKELRRDTFSILNSFEPNKRNESLEEFEEFISSRPRE